jgi:hypothetical protein
MAQPEKVVRASMQKVNLDTGETEGKPVEVQFNPESLKVSFSNQLGSGDESGGAAIQHISQSSTKLAFDLWFDVTAGGPEDTGESDVRELTRTVATLMKPDSAESNPAAPGVRFLWGSFMFDGVIDSINESLEFFDEEGRPLRASLAISMVQQSFYFERNPDFKGRGGAAGGAPATPGTQPREAARDGDSVQQMAARQGRPNDWQAIARANKIENPRQLEPGTLLKVSWPGGRRR